MRRQDNRQVLVMLATSVLILCILHPYPGYICMGLESLICLLLFSVLILFIAKQTAALYDLVLASALCFAGYVFVDTASRWFMDDVSPDTFSIGDPVLPFRFSYLLLLSPHRSSRLGSPARLQARELPVF